jgi:hypothetical protein
VTKEECICYKLVFIFGFFILLFLLTCNSVFVCLRIKHETILRENHALNCKVFFLVSSHVTRNNAVVQIPDKQRLQHSVSFSHITEVNVRRTGDFFWVV